MVSTAGPDVSEVPEDHPVPYFDVLENRLDLANVPFTERGSRILVVLGQATSSERAVGGKGRRQEVSLDVRMAERWTHLEKKIGNHRKRPPLIADLKPLNGSGQPLPFELTTWPHKLLLQTSVGRFEVFFGDEETLYVSFPSAKCGLSGSVMAERFLPDEAGGVFDGVRLVTMTSGRPLMNLRVTGEADGKLFFALDKPQELSGALAIKFPRSSDFSRTVHPTEHVLRRAEQEWQRWFDAAPRVGKRYWSEYYYAWMVMRSGLLSPSGFLKREALAPSKTHYLGIWHWDAYFHAIAYRHVDLGLAQDQLWTMLDYQFDNGFIPDVVHDEGLIVGEDGPNGRELTKPPLMAWAALRLFESGAGKGFLRDIYEPLAKWNNWWLEWCDDDMDGIVQYNHPCSSGLDDSPLWDCGMPVESPDLNTYLCVHMQSLATIARLIGRDADADDWDRKARELARYTSSHFYDEASGVFWATKDHEPIRVLTPFNLLPIWTGHLPPHQVSAVVSKLTDPTTFWSEYGIPTVSPSDTSYDPDRMWRGPTWINVNYMLSEALSRIGYHGLAGTLVDRTIELVMRSGVAEYFNSVTGEVPSRAAPAFGWSAALFIDLLVRGTNSGGTCNTGHGEGRE